MSRQSDTPFAKDTEPRPIEVGDTIYFGSSPDLLNGLDGEKGKIHKIDLEHFHPYQAGNFECWWKFVRRVDDGVVFGPEGEVITEDIIDEQAELLILRQALRRLFLWCNEVPVRGEGIHHGPIWFADDDERFDVLQQAEEALNATGEQE